MKTDNFPPLRIEKSEARTYLPLIFAILGMFL
jgi:hypothetical protein